MPKIVPVLPPKDEAGVKAALERVLNVAKHLKLTLSPEGFVAAWLSDNTRVVIAHEGEEPVGFAIMAFGRRYFDENFTASVLVAEGPARPQVLEFLRDMATMLGAERMFYEHEDGDTLEGVQADMRMVELK